MTNATQSRWCQIKLLGVLVCSGTLLLTSGCGGGDTGGDTPGQPTVKPVSAVSVTLSDGTINVGQSTQAAAVTKDPTGNALSGRTISWKSSAPAISSVSSTGLVTGLTAGTATITATSEGIDGAASITVRAVVASVAVTAASTSLIVGGSTQATATAVDASSNVLTGRSVTWSSGNTAVATVSGAGIVTGLAPGQALIAATVEGQTGTAAFTVAQAPVASVAVTLGSNSVAAGGSTAASALLRDAAGNALTGRAVLWSSNNPSVATFDVQGTVSALGPGTAVITATSAGQIGTATLTVTPGTISGSPVATGIGTSVGQPTTANIGPAGGTVASADGRLTVTVPANAVANTVTITVQPITNEAPGGIGQAYELLPDGQTFANPVQLAWKYSDEDMEGTAPDLMAVAYQESTGYWRKLMSGTFNSANKTLTVTTTHFSRWSTLAGFKLVPGRAAVPVNATQSLSALDCSYVAIPGNSGQSRAARCTSGNFTVNTWAVNSTPGGTPTYGFVVGGSTGATYTAPAQVPSLNPVAVSVSVDANLRVGGRAILQLVSNVLVFSDSWTGTATSVQGLQTSTATVTWVLESQTNNVATYRPTGSVTVKHSLCTYAPSQHVLLPVRGFLEVDYSAPVVTYSGYGFDSWPITLTCPPNPGEPFVASVQYFGGDDPKDVLRSGAAGTVQVVNGVSTISATNVGFGSNKFSYSFTRNR